MIKEQVKEAVKEMFKNNEIEIRIESDGSLYSKTIVTIVDILIDNELVSKRTSVGLLKGNKNAIGEPFSK